MLSSGAFWILSQCCLPTHSLPLLPARRGQHVKMDLVKSVYLEGRFSLTLGAFIIDKHFRGCERPSWGSPVGKKWRINYSPTNGRWALAARWVSGEWRSGCSACTPCGLWGSPVHTKPTSGQYQVVSEFFLDLRFHWQLRPAHPFPIRKISSLCSTF